MAMIADISPLFGAWKRTQGTRSSGQQAGKAISLPPAQPPTMQHSVLFTGVAIPVRQSSRL
jgi:hypothetical protein